MMVGFKLTDSALFDFIASFPDGAHLKCAQTGRYIFSNQHNLAVYGFSDPKQIEGLTVCDLDRFMRPHWGGAFARNIGCLDGKVIKQNRTIVDNERILLDRFGIIHIQNMVKTPLLSHDNQVSSILTTVFDITDQVNKFALFNVYKKIYPKKRQACLHFMQFLNIDTFFLEPLSEKQLDCLLWMLENNTYKSVAEKLQIDTKTVESHIRAINEKLKNISLIHLLEILRSRLYGQSTDNKKNSYEGFSR